MKRAVFQTGGPWHPVDAQARRVAGWLGDAWTLETAPGAQALDRLGSADLFIAAGMEWPGMDTETRPEAWTRAGVAPYRYTPPNEAQRDALRRYVASGRPVLVVHGGILGFHVWPEYGRLLGFRWTWGYTGHSVEAPWPATVEAGHPVASGVGPFRVTDELYFNVVLPPELVPSVAVRGHLAEWVDLPLVLTAEGPAGRLPGAGRTAYLALGHTLDVFDLPEVRRLWLNLVAWLVG